MKFNNFWIKLNGRDGDTKKPNLFTLATLLLNFQYTYVSVSIGEEDEYSIHQGYCKAITEADINCFSAIMNYIL